MVSIIAIAPFALADCPYNSATNFVCYCDNGQRETYYSISDLQEARNNPLSCCYYETKVKTTYSSNSQLVSRTLKTEIGTKKASDSVEPIKFPEPIEYPNYDLKGYMSQFIDYLQFYGIHMKTITLSDFF